MKKKIYNLLSIVILILHFNSQAQNNEGKIHFSRKYSWSKMIENIKYLSNEKIEKFAYMSGNEIVSEYYSILYFFPQKSIYNDNIKEENINNFMRKSENKYFIQHDYEENTLLQVETLLGKHYQITGELRPQNWKILNGMKEIAGHICMNAQYYDSIKDQRIVAWFALDWHLNYGPDKYFGLPGMILEIDINNGSVKITAHTIVHTEINSELNITNNKKEKKITYDKYKKIVRNHIEKQKNNERPWYYDIRYE